MRVNLLHVQQRATDSNSNILEYRLGKRLHLLLLRQLIVYKILPLERPLISLSIERRAFVNQLPLHIVALQREA